MPRPEAAIRAYYRALIQTWGPQDWWPAHTRFEVIVGAYLTQNTAWTNVERALRQLRRAGVLNVAGIRRTPLRELQRMVRPAGYFRQKAQRLKNFVAYLDNRYGGSLARMFARPTEELRDELLGLNGVGPETADSILLYAGGHPVFVVDAYTRRILDRHQVVSARASYEEIRGQVERAFSRRAHLSLAGVTAKPSPFGRRHKFVIQGTAPRAQLYNEYHALLVQVGKRHCLKGGPQCEQCPLERFLPKNRGEDLGPRPLRQRAPRQAN